MKKILYIQKANGIGGSENHLLTLLPRLQGRGFDVQFLSLVKAGRGTDEFCVELERKGISATVTPIRADFDPLCLWQIYSFIKKAKPDLVHTHLIHGDLYGTVAAKLAGVPHVVSTKHGYSSFPKIKKFYRLNKLIAPFVDRYITISQALQEHCIRAEGISADRMVTIHYALQMPSPAGNGTREAIRKEVEFTQDGPLMVAIGRLIQVKGHRYLFEALSELNKKKRKNLRLLVVGDGPLRLTLEQSAVELGIRHEVSFLGFRRDIPHLLLGSDLLVLPTLGEGFGLALLEAMAAGIPIVASNVTSIPEVVIHGETGLLVPPRDCHALAEAICYLSDRPDLRRRMGKAGQQRVQDHFTVEKMVEATEKLYEEILTGSLPSQVYAPASKMPEAHRAT